MSNNLTSPKTVYAVAAVRVSTLKQGVSGDSPDDQKIQIQRHVKSIGLALNRNIIIVKWFEFIESGSGSLELQPVMKALEYCKQSEQKISYFFIKSIDRFTRGGATIYGQLKANLAKYGIDLIDTYGIIGQQKVNTLEHLGLQYDWSSFSPTFIPEMLEAERGKSEVRDILTRMIGAEVRYVRMGYGVRTAPYGLQNVKIDTVDHGVRVTRAPHPDESKHILKMFQLRIQGSKSDIEIVKEVNKAGYRSRLMKIHDKTDKRKIIGFKGGRPLTVKQLQTYIQKPIYAGVNVEKWTDEKPIKCLHFDGIVKIEEFNKANRGKIVIDKQGDILTIYRNKPEKWRLTKRRDNPDFPYKKYVLCPKCSNPLLGSAPRSKSGRHIPYYHCARGHKYWSVNKEQFNELIESFVKEVKLTRSFRKKFREIVLEEWEKRRNQAHDESVTYDTKISQMKQEQQMIGLKIPMLESPVAIKQMESQLERLELEMANLKDERTKKENQEIDIQILINYCEYFMEHLQELLLDGSNPLKDADMFGVIFDKLPTYDELENRTPCLAPVFELNRQYETSKSLTVSRQGFEP